jgi:hypothetical protein
MKYISIAFVVLAAGANFALAQTPPPPPPNDTYTNYGPCPYHDAFYRLSGSTQWEGRAENPGGNSAFLYYFVTDGPLSNDPRNSFENRDKMQKYCNQKISCGGSASGTASAASFWPE